MEVRNNTREIGERVRTLRVQKGMSQEELARRLNLGSRSMVSEYESGKEFSHQRASSTMQPCSMYLQTGSCLEQEIRKRESMHRK